LDLLSSVGKKAIPDQNHSVSPELVAEVFEKVEDRWGIDVPVRMKSKVKANEIPLG